MHILKFIFSLTLLLTSTCFSQNPTAEKDSSLIVSSPFSEPTALTRKAQLQGWSATIGQWQVKDGALHGDELAEDHHHSSCTYRLKATDLIITAQFKLGTASFISFGCRDDIAPHHHLARTFISPSAIWVTHMSGIAKTTQSAKLEEIKTPIDPNTWHSIEIKIIGDHYSVKIDNHQLQAQHPRFKDTKGIVALINKGQGAQFKNVVLKHGPTVK
jgi:hypothetical protein